jgi:hypothetical protein
MKKSSASSGHHTQAWNHRRLKGSPSHRSFQPRDATSTSRQIAQRPRTPSRARFTHRPSCGEYPERRGSCARNLSRSGAVKEETRQVFDLPEVSAVVTEHRVETRRCSCGVTAAASFAKEAIGPSRYGPGVLVLLT